MAQFARPDADEAVGSWATAPLWSKIDDTEALGDGVEISSETVGNNATTSFADVRLSDITDPVTAKAHVLRVRWRNGGEGGSARDIIGHCELWEGVPGTGTLRAEITPPTLLGSDATEVEHVLTLSAAQANSIGDYTNLYVRLWGQGSGGGPGRSLRVEKVLFTAPSVAAALDVHVGSVALRTTPGAQTISTVGFQGKLGWFWLTLSDTDNADDNFCGLSYGAADAHGVQGCSAAMNRGDGAGAAAGSRTHDNRIAVGVTPSGGVEIGVAHTGWTSTGFTINVTDNVFGNATILNWVILSGDGLPDANVVHKTVPAASGNESDTSLNYPPAALLFCGGYVSTINTGTANGGSLALGVTDGLVQAAAAYGMNAVNGVSRGIWREDRCYVYFTDFNPPTLRNDAAFVSRDSNGWTVTWDNAQGGQKYFVVALDIRDASVLLDVQKTSTGLQPKTGTGFPPKLTLFVSAERTATETAFSNPGALVVGASDLTTDRSAWVEKEHSGVDSTTSAFSHMRSVKAIQFRNTGAGGGGGSSALDAEAHVDSFDSDGYTPDWTTADAVARKFVTLAVGGAPLADTALAGAGAGSGTGTGVLTTQIALAGAGAGAGTGLADLTTAIPLTGAGTGAGVGVGDLTTALALSGAGSGSVVGAGDLTTAIALAATGAGAATGLGDLTTAIPLSGAGAVTGLGAGDLTTAIALRGAGAAEALGVADLTTQIALVGSGAGAGVGTGVLASSLIAGSGAGTGIGAGVLTTQITLVGSGAGAAAGVGDLTTAIALRGVGAADTLGLADLSTAIALVASGAGAGVGQADLSTAIALRGSGAGDSLGTGVLSAAFLALLGAGAAQGTGLGVLTTAIALAGQGAGQGVGVGVLTTLAAAPPGGEESGEIAPLGGESSLRVTWTPTVGGGNLG